MYKRKINLDFIYAYDEIERHPERKENVFVEAVHAHVLFLHNEIMGKW